MATNVKTFGEYLRHFARSVDIVDEYTIEGVRDLVYVYVRDELQADYFSLACEQVIDGRAGLGTLWSTENEMLGITILIPPGTYSSQISVSFGERKPLWVVSPSRQSLRRSPDYIDLWSGIKNLPRYQAPLDPDMKTSIILPLIHWSRALGVLYWESASYIEATEAAKDELLALSDAIAILLELRQVNRTQLAGTRAALSDLEAILINNRLPRLIKPQAFVTFSPRASRDVATAIQQVMDQCSDLLEIVWVGQDSEVGLDHIASNRKIARSRLGLCYFSEPSPDSENEFEDDPNVLFEAGMLHSLANSPAATAAGWIPIREELSPRALPGFESERLLIVPRSNEGKLMEERLYADLRSRVRALLK